jgi:xylulokinase
LAEDLIVGVDVGTSSIKILFLSLDGTFFRKDEEKLTTIRDGERAEQDAREYLTAIKKITSRHSDLVPSVKAIGLSGHTPSVVCIDKFGEPTMPVLIWQDNRAQSEATELAKKFNNPVDIIGTSLPWSPSACPAKMLWIHRHLPEVQNATAWILQPKDFLGFHLTGEAISDPWSSKGLCNVLTSKAPTGLFDFLGWSESVIPEIRKGELCRGVVTESGSAVTGFPSGVPVTVGWSDAMSGMNALGVMAAPTSFVITGTSAIVGSSTRSQVSDGDCLYVIPQTCAPMSVVYGPTQSSGAAIAWGSQLLGVNENELIEMGRSDDSKSVPMFLPYISGERAPLWRNDIRGGFLNIDQSCSASTLSRSIMEGISFSEKQVLTIAQGLASDAPAKVSLGGHAGNDPRWERVRARTLGEDLESHHDTDTTTRGAAMLALNLIIQNFELSFKKLSVKPKHTNTSQAEREYSQLNFPAFLSAQESVVQFTDSTNDKRNHEFS